MNNWQKRIQKRTDISAKLLVLLGCIVKKAGMLLNPSSYKWKSTEEAKQPLDYEKKHWHKYDWEKWVNDNKDNWS